MTSPGFTVTAGTSDSLPPAARITLCASRRVCTGPFGRDWASAAVACAAMRIARANAVVARFISVPREGYGCVPRAPYEAVHRAKARGLQMQPPGDERSFLPHGRASQALDAAQRELGDAVGEEPAGLGALRESGRDPLDGGPRSALQHARP